MKNKSRIFFAAIVIIMINFPAIFSQTSRVVYFMKIPQNHLLNPAIKPANRYYIGLPALSGISAGLGNNFVSLTDFVVPNLKSDQIFTFQDPAFDLTQLADNLKASNTITSEGGIQILGISVPIGKNYAVFFDVNDRIAAKAVFPKSLLDLYMTGAGDFINKTIDISNIRLTGQYYREYGLGFSADILKNLRVGGKFKLLSGMASISLDNKLFNLKVNGDLSQTVSTNVSLDIGGQETIRRIFSSNNFLFKSVDGAKANFGGFLSDYLLNPVINSGVAFDFGAVYNLGKLFSFSASVTDLGFINWKNEVKSYNSQKTFSLPGITLEQVVNQTFSIDDMMGRLRDSIKSNFTSVESPQPFKTYLPTTILAGGSINIFPFFSAGILSESKIYSGNFKESLVLSGNFYVGRTVSASVSYTLTNASYNNLGVGLAVKAGFVQMYLIADKIPLSWEKVYFKQSGNQYSGKSLPENLNMLSMQLGFNITFGNPVTKKTDKPMLLEEKQD